MIKVKKETLFNEEFYKYKKPEYEKCYIDTVKMYLSGSWFKCFSSDAEILNKFFGLKIYEEGKDIFCGFPAYMLGKVCNKLKKESISYLVVILSTDIQDYVSLNSNPIFNQYNTVLKEIRESNLPSNRIKKILESMNEYDEKNINKAITEYSHINEINSIKRKNTIIRRERNKSIRKNEYKGNIVEIGDKVKIRKLINNTMEEFTIMPTYRNEVPKNAVTLKSGYRYIKYKSELSNNNDVEKGEIISESPFAKAMLGKSKNMVFEFKDLDGNIEKYFIVDIIKNVI